MLLQTFHKKLNFQEVLFSLRQKEIRWFDRCGDVLFCVKRFSAHYYHNSGEKGKSFHYC